MTVYAVKRLTRSDLTFFEYQFRRQNAGNQKSINLNADVFVDLIFPYARTVAAGQPHQFPVLLQIFGPGLRTAPDNKTRKVIAAGGAQKNWRLNGEFVPDPDDDPTRYHGLQAADLVVFAFDDNGVQPVPEAVVMVLVSASEEADASVLDDLRHLIGSRRMSLISHGELAEVSSRSPIGHPIRELIDRELDEALEEAALGSSVAQRELQLRPSNRRMSATALARARARAEENGRDGELLVKFYLERAVSSGHLQSFLWTSEENAISAWDFEATDENGNSFRIEVKSTGGDFARPIHISTNEIIAAAAQGAPSTVLYRVFNVSGEGAVLRTSRGLAQVAQEILNVTKLYNPGVMPDGFTVAVDCFSGWTDPEQLGQEASEDDD